MPLHQQRRRRILVMSASLLVLFGLVTELTELVYDNGRVTYLVFGGVLIVLGVLGLLWARADARGPEVPASVVPPVEPEQV